jgi:hypothetical protein
MARIPTEELERLKAEVSVERLVEASGVDLLREIHDATHPAKLHRGAPDVEPNPDAGGT